MALDFPASPTNGQVYGSYVYNSTVGAWQAREDSATVATISTVLPTNANPGDIWYDNDDGTSYIYYDDGTSAQWVELLSSGVPLLNTKANLAGDNSFSGGVNYFGAGGTNGTFISSNSGRAQFSTNNIALTPLTVRGIAGQTNALQEWQDSTSAVILKVTSGGNLSVGAAVTPLEKIHATGRILGSSASYYSTNVIGTSIGESSDGNSTADIDMRRWKGSANLHGTGRIATDINSNMLFYTDDKTTNTYASTERMRISSAGLVLQTALSVANGGTGTTTLASGGYLKGNGTGAISSQTGIPAGDITSGTVSYSRLPAGTIRQIIYASTGTQVTSSTTASWTDTGLTATITPTSATSKILVILNQNGITKQTSNNIESSTQIQLVKNGVAFSTWPGNLVGYSPSAGYLAELGVGYTILDTAGTTSAITYKTQFKNYVNASFVSVQHYGGTSSMTLLEILQ